VDYAGTSEDLIAAGCVTSEMVAPCRPGQGLQDVDGDIVRREFRKGWLRVTRTKPVGLALKLPGISIDAIRAAMARFEVECPDLSAYERPRPHLRLVVNNDVARPVAHV
jgi:hypothetical protein